jgi:hypothetical protein
VKESCVTVKRPFAVELLPLLLRHPGQQAEVVFFNRFLPTLSLELALRTMPIQDKVGRQAAGK